MTSSPIPATYRRTGPAGIAVARAVLAAHRPPDDLESLQRSRDAVTQADLEALAAEEYADELQREREWDALEAARHEASGQGDTDDGSERAW